MKAKKLIANTLKYVLLAVVAAFLALHSINLFKWVFPATQSYYAWLGFGLTGFGAIVYLLMFLWEGTTWLQRTISLVMVIVCAFGEVLAAGAGMYIEAFEKADFIVSEQDFQIMIIGIGLLALAHFAALVVYFAGDKIAELFADEDGDGIPNVFDKDYSKKRATTRQYAKTVENPTNRPQQK